MLKLLYNVALMLVFILSLPKWLWEALIHKKHRRSFFQKLGFQKLGGTLPLLRSAPYRIWVHAISVGETKAVGPLVEQLHAQYPQASIVFSTVTETGMEEAKRTIAHIDHYFFLPLDFSWIIRKLMKQIHPDLLILVEGDFWFNLINQAPQVVLVNGKISEKSAARFKKVPFFSHRLFKKLALLCVQSQRYAARFIELGVDRAKIVVTGNLKLDQSFLVIDKEQWKQALGISSLDQVITLASTHETEEELLLDVLAPLLIPFPHLKFLVVPRHPERFEAVATLLQKKGIEFNRYALRDVRKHRCITLVDAMGILNVCYQLSEIAVVGGSFIEKVGGHNIFEPAALGVPVLFGPWMDAQQDLVELVTHAGAGRQVQLRDLASTIENLLRNGSHDMHQAGLTLSQQVHGATHRTLQALLRAVLKTIRI